MVTKTLWELKLNRPHAYTAQHLGPLLVGCWPTPEANRWRQAAARELIWLQIEGVAPPDLLVVMQPATELDETEFKALAPLL